MKRSIFAFAAGLVLWVVVVSVLNRGLRIFVMGYAAAGSLEYSTVAMSCVLAPAANSISVAPGVRLTMRSGGRATAIVRPRSSDTERRASAAGGSADTPGATRRAMRVSAARCARA